MGVVVVVPITVWRDKEDWWDVLLGDRVPGRRMGELEGVIFKDALGPASLLFERGVVAMTYGFKVPPKMDQLGAFDSTEQKRV